MRIVLIFPALLLSWCAFSQKAESYYQQQQNVIQAPVQDCYYRNLDAGMAAKSRGDCPAALRFFKEAQECAETKTNSRRKSELDALIAECTPVPGKKAAKSEAAAAKSARPRIIQTEPPRQYLPSVEFLHFHGDSCFAVTRKEADRAFAQRCWDDAAKLYRAAKTCADADQMVRQKMNDRITACRDAAEDELRQKELEAIRQARQAIANNIADDAQTQLRKYNRSLAYRLADFANEYIAPEDNPHCVQALLDAWYYVPANYGVTNSDLRVPFCYQLANNLPQNIIMRTAGRGPGAKIYILAIDNHTLYSWDAESFEPQEPIQVDEDVFDFGVSPDGHTLLFISKNEFTFWRGAKQSIKVKGTRASSWTFNPRGDIFYYFNADARIIYLVNLRDAFVPRRGGGRTFAFNPYITNLDARLITFKAHNNSFWLGYPDHLEVIRKKNAGDPWEYEGKYRFSKLPNVYRGLNIFPADRKVVITGDSTVAYTIPESQVQTMLQPDMLLPVNNELALNDDGSLMLYLPADNNSGGNSQLAVKSISDNQFRYAAYVSPDEWERGGHGIFSPDGRWLLTVSGTGSLQAWDLSVELSGINRKFGHATDLHLSPDGRRLMEVEPGQLLIHEADQSGQTPISVPVVADRFALLTVSGNWLVYREAPDTIIARHIDTGRRLSFPVNSVNSSGLQAVVSPDEQLIAFTDNEKSVTISALSTGVVVASKTFEESIFQLRFVPGKQDLIVIQVDLGHFNTSSQNTVAKIWSYARPDTKPRVVRMHGYDIKYTELSPQGDFVAFSDGRDIRVFQMDALSDEISRMHRTGTGEISSIMFHPNGSSVAAGYEDGTVRFWDIKSGEPLFQLLSAYRKGDPRAIGLCFASGGEQLKQVNADQTYLMRGLSLPAIRNLVQTDFRRLVAFTPEQIREYDLEGALNYPGNFERLANSGEWPLIRSFFEYYYQQSLRSNNIAQVSEYCKRAFVLYQQLDHSTQQTLKSTMLDMYRDYNWKWLLRGNPTEAAAVVSHMERNFQSPLAAVEAGAYTALLRGDLTKATRMFTDLTVRSFEKIPAGGLAAWTLPDTLQTKFQQLAEYDLLEAPQLDCICGMYAGMLDLKFLCPEGNTFSVSFDPETRLRWNIFQNTYMAQEVYHHERKNDLLQAALSDAKTLYRQKPATWRGTMERATIEVAKNYLAWGDFEQGSVLAVEHYRKALGLLTDLGQVSEQYDSTRLALIARSHLSLGNLLMTVDNTGDAMQEYQAGIQTAGLLLDMVRDTILLATYRNNLMGSLYQQIGNIGLLDGDAAAARAAFDQADHFLYTPLPGYYYGHAALLEHAETEALARYAEINYEQYAGQALFDVAHLAFRLPQQAAYLNAFLPRIRKAVLANQRLNPNMVDYWQANNKTTYYAVREKWDSTLLWSTIAFGFAEKALVKPDAPSYWKDDWLDEHINQAYYLVLSQWRDTAALSKAIRFSEQAEAFTQDKYLAYSHKDYIKPNMAHAHLLRNQPGDRAKALQEYKDYLAIPPENGRSRWEILEKDFRDLARFGVVWPNLDEIIAQIKPDDEKQ